MLSGSISLNLIPLNWKAHLIEPNQKPRGRVPTCVGYLCGLPFLGRERRLGYITGSCGAKAVRGKAKNTVLAQTAEHLGTGVLEDIP